MPQKRRKIDFDEIRLDDSDGDSRPIKNEDLPPALAVRGEEEKASAVSSINGKTAEAEAAKVALSTAATAHVTKKKTARKMMKGKVEAIAEHPPTTEEKVEL